MTISSTTSRWSYTGNGTTGPFAYTTKIFANTDLKVYVAGTLKTLTTHYTVTVGDTGNVTFTAGNEPAVGAEVVIVKDVPNVQSSSLPLGGSFPSTTVETALDKATIQIQQVKSRVERTLRQPDSDATDISEMPVKASRASKHLAFDANGNPIAADAPEGGNVVSAFMATVLDDTDAATARATLGAAGTAVANTFTESQTIQSSDAGASEGPTFTLDRSSASPAASDLIGVLRWLVKDSGGNSDAALKILGEIVDATAASEDARLLFQTIIAGTLATRATIQHGLFMAGATGGDQGTGTINAVEFYKNGTALPLTKSFTSSNQTITAGGALTLAHSLGAAPTLVQISLVCVTDEGGYVAGDVVPVNPNQTDGTGANARGAAITFDATSVFVRFGSTATTFNALNKGSGANVALTNANWALRVKAWV